MLFRSVVGGFSVGAPQHLTDPVLQVLDRAVALGLCLVGHGAALLWGMIRGVSTRVVDRPIRPLFPKDMRNDVCVTMTVMSLDPDNSAEITGMNGASLAIAMSDIPWNGPIGGVAVGLVDGEIVLNPTKEQRERSDLALTLAASQEKIVMIEAGANEVDEETMMAAIKAGHAEIKKMLAFINSIVAEIGKPKKSFTPVELDHALLADVYAKHLDEVKAAMDMVTTPKQNPESLSISTSIISIISLTNKHLQFS